MAINLYAYEKLMEQQERETQSASRQAWYWTSSQVEASQKTNLIRRLWRTPKAGVIPQPCCNCC